jgi:hypothetical protein
MSKVIWISSLVTCLAHLYNTGFVGHGCSNSDVREQSCAV